MTNKKALRTALAAWWGETFVTDYVIDRNGDYKSQADCIEDLVIRLSATVSTKAGN